MSLIDYVNEIKDAPEPYILQKGEEVKVRITNVRVGESEGRPYWIPMYEVPDQPMANEFSDFFWTLSSDNKEILTRKQWERNIYNTKCFLECFGVDLTKPFDPEEDFIGLEGWVIVGVKSSEEYGDQNTVRKYIK
jgi:hypothetical protein